MIKKIINKIKKDGIKKTSYLINQRVYEKFESKFNLLNRKKNYIRIEKDKYWASFNYIKRKYLKDIKKMKVIKGSSKNSNKVWWCWLQGENNCPKLQKICLNSLKKELKDRDIVVISKDNMYDYISFPNYIIEKYEKGIISNTHFSDLLRLELLIKYGGTWIDSSVLCTNYNHDFFDKPLFVYKNCNNIWYANRSKFNQEPMIADNWFITSEIGNPILIAVRDLLYKYWKDHNYLVDYFIFHYFFTLVVLYKYNDLFNSIPTIPHVIPHLLQNEYFNKYNEIEINHILNQSSFHKMTNKVDLGTIRDDSFYKMIIQDRYKL